METTMQIASLTSHAHGKPDNSVQEKEPGTFLTDETLATIIDQLLAQGLSRDEIVMPGSAQDAIRFIADDFDAPINDFTEYI